MIINLPTIANKRVVSNPDGSKIVELGESVFQYRKQAIVDDFIVVTDDQAGKPWLIAQALYLRENALAPLFFLNGYPNPYAIDAGDKLLKFSEESLNNIIIDNNSITKEFNNVKPQDSTQTSQRRERQTKVDQNRQAVLNKISAAGNNSNTAIAPNASVGVAPFIASDGLITLGTDVSEARCKSTNLSDTQTRTEQIRAAIRKKLGVSK